MTPQALELVRKIERDIERDIRNQLRIDRMKRLPWRARLEARINRHPFAYAYMACIAFWLLVFAGIRHAFS